MRANTVPCNTSWKTEDFLMLTGQNLFTIKSAHTQVKCSPWVPGPENAPKSLQMTFHSLQNGIWSSGDPQGFHGPI